jgi:hypothetical protein
MNKPRSAQQRAMQFHADYAALLAAREARRRKLELLGDIAIALAMFAALSSPIWLGPLLKLLAINIDN